MIRKALFRAPSQRCRVGDRGNKSGHYDPVFDGALNFGVPSKEPFWSALPLRRTIVQYARDRTSETKSG
jgi:hypothetical protein